MQKLDMFLVSKEVGAITMQDIEVFFCFLCSELDQSNVTEENPEGEEHPPADSENK